jgi:DNA mismatch repair ATPase MutS
MVIDQTTLHDLSIFHPQEEASLFSRFNFTRTSHGRHYLLHALSNPLNNLKAILQMQQTLECVAKKSGKWPDRITNGTLMVLERFFDSQIDPMPRHANMLNGWGYRLLHNPDYALTKYTLGHAADFLQGMIQLQQLFTVQELPAPLQTVVTRIRMLLSIPEVASLAQMAGNSNPSPATVVHFGHFLLTHFKNPLRELMELFGKLDAWYAMAQAIDYYQLRYPVFDEGEHTHLEATGLYHLLLDHPVPYDLTMTPDANFVFLTGANMAGKSTLIRAVGAAVYLAHLGMGVPASCMKLSLFQGLLSNIQVVDNIAKGESFFFNEVQRIKHTILRINDGNKWLVLIDELFKGTNVQDAMRCSAAVIKGLLKIKNCLCILSTHLYEIGEELKEYPNITFRYFETQVTAEELSFSYQLREGISNDRIGYLIMKQQGVVDLLEKL